MIPQVRPPQESKILIVDDEASNRDIMTQFLQMEGFQLFTAVDGEQAMEMVESVQPDLVLLDIIMPRLDGYEVCRLIKSNEETAFLPVIMITALKGTEEKIKGVEVGADDFLTKPFNYLELVTRVKSLLRVKHLSDQLKDSNRILEKTVASRTAQLRKALEELRELDRLKSEFIANVSHELRTPLLHVKGYVALMADGILGPLNEDQTEGLTTTRAAVERLERLIEDIVDFGGADIGKIHLGPINLRDSIQVATSMLERTIANSPCDLVIEYPEKTVLVQGEMRSLARVFRHLLDNAVKFSPNGGNVIIRVKANTDKGVAHVEVIDHGIGIPADKLERIFDKFYQVDGSATRRFGGTGIGLALAYRLLEGHNAKIHVYSEPHKGTRFWFDLPLVQVR